MKKNRNSPLIRFVQDLKIDNFCHALTDSSVNFEKPPFLQLCPVLIGLGTFELYLDVSLTVGSNLKKEKNQVAVNLRWESNVRFVNCSIYRFFKKNYC